MALIRDASTPQGITREGGYTVTVLPDTGPGGERFIRNQLRDGMTGAGAAMESERNDGQLGGVPLNADRVVVWFERFTEMPTTSLDRWQVVGPEVHGPNITSFPQAVLMLEVGPDRRRRLNANAGRASVRYFDIGAIEPGRVYAMEMHVRLSASTTGFIRVWRDGQLAVDYRGVTIHTEVGGSYWKEANYRNARIDGNMTHDFASLRIHDADVEFGPGHTPAPPSPVDTTPPRINLAVDATGAWDIDLPDLADTVSVLVGVAGDPVEPRLLGTGLAASMHGRFDVARLTPGVTYWAWATAMDAARNIGSTPGIPFTIPAPAPPPEPAECAEVRARLAAREATLADRLAAIDRARADLRVIGGNARSRVLTLNAARWRLLNIALAAGRGLEHLED